MDEFNSSQITENMRVNTKHALYLQQATTIYYS